MSASLPRSNLLQFAPQPAGSMRHLLARRAPQLSGEESRAADEVVGDFPWPAHLHDGSVPPISRPDQMVSDDVLFSLHEARSPLTDQMVSDEPSTWFSEIIERLQIKDAGFVLSKLTGFIERTCYRYAAGARAVPGYFIRCVLRSSYGGLFLNEMMRDCDAQWWVELQEARTKAALLDGFLADVKKRGFGAALVRKADWGSGDGR